jgi:hypothetical protein
MGARDDDRKEVDMRAAIQTTLTMAGLAAMLSACTSTQSTQTQSGQTAQLAQGVPIEFRLVPASGNPAGCTQLDSAMSRVHTVTPMGSEATIRSAGGINDTLKQTSPNVYTTQFRLGAVTLNVVADASRMPRTLNVTEPKIGCRWNAIAR